MNNAFQEIGCDRDIIKQNATEAVHGAVTAAVHIIGLDGLKQTSFFPQRRARDRRHYNP